MTIEIEDPKAENVENNMPTPPNDTLPTSPTIDYIKAKKIQEKVPIKRQQKRFRDDRNKTI